MDHNVRRDVFPVCEYRSLQYRSRKRVAARVRATAFAVNIFMVHAFGDVQAFWLLGYIGGHTNMHVAFLFVSGIIFLSGLVWLIGVKYLPADTAAVEKQTG